MTPYQGAQRAQVGHCGVLGAVVPPCRLIGPVLDAIAAERAGLLDVVKLNIDENPRTAQKYEILLVPTLNLFCGGEVVKQVIGAKSKSALLREFAEFLEPDPVSR